MVVPSRKYAARQSSVKHKGSFRCWRSDGGSLGSAGAGVWRRRDVRALRRGATRSDWTRSESTGGARAKNIPPVCYITRVDALLNHRDPSAIWSPGDVNLMDRIPARVGFNTRHVHPSYWCCDAFRQWMIKMMTLYYKIIWNMMVLYRIFTWRFQSCCMT